MAGNTPRYKTPQEMQSVIDLYFEECKGRPMIDKNGDHVLNKYGYPVILENKPPTVTGLALRLGFTSRQALLNYQAKKAFVDTVTRAKSRVEEYAETRLFDREGAMGAKFSLTNNFKGWSESPDDGHESELIAQAAKVIVAIKDITNNGKAT